MNQSVTEVFVEQPLASPGCVKNRYIDGFGYCHDIFEGTILANVVLYVNSD